LTASEAAPALDATAEPGRAYWYRVSLTLVDGSDVHSQPVQATRPLVGADGAALLTSALTMVSPNPAPNAARIDYVAARRENVRVTVLDVMGRQVAVLVDGVMEAGRHSVVLDPAATHAPLRSGL